MPQSAIFQPFFAMIALTVLVWLYMYARRIPFILGSKLTPEQLAIPGELARLSPPSVSNPSDNFKNQFELPVLFYVLALYLYTVQQVDAVYVAASWVFVGFRAAHSLMHCTLNIVMARFYLYLGAALALFFIAGRAVLAAL